jgi:hypothetical protein
VTELPNKSDKYLSGWANYNNYSRYDGERVLPMVIVIFDEEVVIPVWDLHPVKDELGD